MNVLMEVAHAAQRARLLAELQANRWNLSQTAVALRITNGPAAVSRLIGRLGLSNEYDAAKAEGRVDPRGRSRRRPVAT